MRPLLAMQGYRRRLVKTSVGDIHVVDAEGTGPLPPLVLLHGISSAGAHYLPLLNQLRPMVQRVIAPDLPAHGFSATPPVGATLATMRAGLLEALDEVLDRPAVVFGNSMGGAAAIAYTRLRPERVLGLALCSPGGAAMTPDELGAFRRSFQLDSHTDALAFVDRLFARPNPLRHALALGIRASFAQPEIRAILSAIDAADLFMPEHLASLAMPVLLIWGRGDRIFPDAHREYFRRHLPPHARMVEPETFGHAPYLDNPSEVASYILEFAREVAHSRYRAPAGVDRVEARLPGEPEPAV
jgi:pimeloyl-ACP methyl ester carboxylesterase